MKRLLSFYVIILTLLTGCTGHHALLQPHIDVECKNHAYLRMPLEEFITNRYRSNPQLRLGIMPFSVPAIFARQRSDKPGWGDEIAQGLHAKIISSGAVNIVEVLDPRDWPGKKDEFYKGNFTAMEIARQAGYDLLLVGQLEDFKNIHQVSAVAKLIDVNGDITVWYGQSLVSTPEAFPRGVRDPFGALAQDTPSKLTITDLKEPLVSCLVKNILSEERVP